MANTHDDLGAAGFADVHRHIAEFGSSFDPSRRTLYGYAVN